MLRDPLAFPQSEQRAEGRLPLRDKTRENYQSKPNEFHMETQKPLGVDHESLYFHS